MHAEPRHERDSVTPSRSTSRAARCISKHSSADRTVIRMSDGPGTDRTRHGHAGTKPRPTRAGHRSGPTCHPSSGAHLSRIKSRGSAKYWNVRVGLRLSLCDPARELLPPASGAASEVQTEQSTTCWDLTRAWGLMTIGVPPLPGATDVPPVVPLWATRATDHCARAPRAITARSS
jgi:hypothetical protein